MDSPYICRTTRLFNSLRTIGTGILIAVCLLPSLSMGQGGYTKLAEAPAGKYLLEKTHAYITASYSHQGFSRPILAFRDFDATIQLDPTDVSATSVNVSINPASIDSGVSEFDDHLKGEDFFDVEKFPEAGFSSTDIEHQKGSQYAVTGNLTLHGVSKPVTLQATFNKGGMHFKEGVPHLGFSATATLKRSDWGLGYAAPFVGDEVVLVIETEFLREK